MRSRISLAGLALLLAACAAPEAAPGAPAAPVAAPVAVAAEAHGDLPAPCLERGSPAACGPGPSGLWELPEPPPYRGAP